jgi:hypothetical protein
MLCLRADLRHELMKSQGLQAYQQVTFLSESSGQQAHG